MFSEDDKTSIGQWKYAHDAKYAQDVKYTQDMEPPDMIEIKKNQAGKLSYFMV